MNITRLPGEHVKRLARFAACLAAAIVSFTMLGSGAQTEPSPPSANKSRSNTIVITGTQEVAFGEPQVYVLLRKDKQVVMGEPGGTLLDDAKPGTRVSSFRACLDTGAGLHMISKKTAARFGLKTRPDTSFRLFGINGALIVIASTPYQLALAGASGRPFGQSPGRFHLIHRDTTLSVATTDPALSISQISDLNLIGMPAIKKWIVELDPSPMRQPSARLGAGPGVRLLEENESVPDDVDVHIALEYVDDNQHHQLEFPSPHPAYAGRPVFNDVVSQHYRSTYTAKWLLDTGAATSVISVRHAQSLGLYQYDGTPARPADFTLRLSGIEGSVRPIDGYILDRLSIPAKGGKTLEFRNVHVVVKDIGATEENGRVVVLDGIFGMNLLLPGVSGAGSLGEEGSQKSNRPGITIGPGAFERIWIDGPRGVLSLRLQKQ